MYVCRPKPVREYVVCERAWCVWGMGGAVCACVRASTTRFTVVSFAVMVDWALKKTIIYRSIQHTIWIVFNLHNYLFVQRDKKKEL